MKTRAELVEVIACAMEGRDKPSHTSNCRSLVYVCNPPEKCNCGFIGQAERVLTAIEAAGGRVVPLVATEEMRLVGAECMPDYDPGCDDAQECYTAMLNANPFKGE